MRNKYNISRIRHDGQWIEGDKEIGKSFANHLQKLLGTLISSRFLVDWQNLFDYKERVDLSSLD